MTTIKDVATRAGVGIGTVSRVLNDHPAVTHATRAKVIEAINSLDYQPNRVARALSRQRSGSVAVAVPFFTHPSAIERLRGVVDALDASPYEVVLFNLDHADHRPGRLTRLTHRDLADGLLMVSLRPSTEETKRFRATEIPTVIIDAEDDGFPCIVVDDVAGGRLAARHLIDLGHRRIGYVGDAVDGRFGFTSSARRLDGLAAELADHCDALPADLVRLGTHSREVACRLTQELLGLDRPPTAIFAHSDTQAFGVMDAADLLGLRIPQDISVIGFDDIEAARSAGLTTIRQPLFESGRLGAHHLLDALNAGRAGMAERIQLPLELVVRRTTGPAPAVHLAAGPAHRRPA